MPKNTVCIGLLGPTLDQGRTQERWNKWRPSVSLCQHEDLIIHTFELIYQTKFKELADLVVKDIQSVSPETQVNLHVVDFRDPWNFPDVFSSLMDFAQHYTFDTDRNDYLVHITTGTHVAQICEFLLTEARYFPAKLIQTSPLHKRVRGNTRGKYSIIDLNLSHYDQIAKRFESQQIESLSFLKAGIETRNKSFNKLIEQIERVAISSTAPFLLMGPTGAGKSSLANRIYELKKIRNQISGPFVEVNCATITGEMAMSTLFGHAKGSFTGALKDRAGLLREADQGLLFLDEIGELGLDEQAMLLKAIEEKTFLPLGADQPVRSDFTLIAGTNKDLRESVQAGTFREDLLSRINLWTFALPALRDRIEDIEANIEYELTKYAKENGKRITFNKEAYNAFLKFSKSPKATWRANFRDLNAAITRMATLSNQGRIDLKTVKDEIERLNVFWKDLSANTFQSTLLKFFAEEDLGHIDLIDQVQLSHVISVCENSKSLSEAGRTLFAVSRLRKKNTNDADRLKKYLEKFGLNWARLHED